MFGFSDFLSFLLALFFIYPIVSLVHELGHSFFAWLFGGKFSFSLGRGRTVFKKGPFILNSMYFLDAFCEYGQLKWNNRLTHFLVHAGGVIFNLGSVVVLNILISKNIIEPQTFFVQYSYFSVWLAAFSLIPVDYGNENYSDGLSIYHVLRNHKWPKLTG
ncbi:MULTISPECIES: hypothetical protein [Mesobacillus]|uniref:Peptidase M50 domain-containing protein n=2 Tax=Mesobacillus TaxID=2675231 RepID=A0A0D6Z8N0_9BACI|nr:MULTISPECIES: hypothetical protein [Mesobacillus]KIY21720.1 hypothetical protein UB32_12505 [Mesobacillus subterraneus]MDQ0413566.1 hypothetical protein [Mesobacillus stamsii]